MTTRFLYTFLEPLSQKYKGEIKFNSTYHNHNHVFFIGLKMIPWQATRLNNNRFQDRYQPTWQVLPSSDVVIHDGLVAEGVAGVAV